jgi:hypothetical protein
MTARRAHTGYRGVPGRSLAAEPFAAVAKQMQNRAKGDSNYGEGENRQRVHDVSPWCVRRTLISESRGVSVDVACTYRRPKGIRFGKSSRAAAPLRSPITKHNLRDSDKGVLKLFAFEGAATAPPLTPG